MEGVERAQARVESVRALLTASWLILADAWEAGDHVTLGYGSWSEYMTGEYGDLRLNLDGDDRSEAVMWLLGAGMTQGQVGETLGVSQSTVSRAVTVKRTAMHMHNLQDGPEDNFMITLDPANAPCQQGTHSEDKSETGYVGTEGESGSTHCPTCRQAFNPAHEDTWDGIAASMHSKVVERLRDSADTASHVLSPEVAMHFERIKRGTDGIKGGRDEAVHMRTILDAVTELASTLVSNHRG